MVADCLSRPANAVCVDICDLTEIARQQSLDKGLQLNTDKLRSFELDDDLKLWCDTSLQYPRPCIPEPLRKTIFDSFHNLSHPGIKSSIKLLKSRFCWPDMDRSIRDWCRECMSCQQAKIHKHTHSPVTHFNLPSARFQTLHMDIVGPLPTVRNPTDPYVSHFRYILTFIDRSTRWIEACPLSDITALSVANAFITTWISRFGVPLHVITDRGSQFESELFAELAKSIGFLRLRSTSYHPQTNGMIERMHRTLKTAIMARKQSWLEALPVVLLGLRSIPNESGYSPFCAVTGTDLLVPQILIDPNPETDKNVSHDVVKKLSEEMSKFDTDFLSRGKLHSVPKSYIPTDLKTCERVWLRVDRVRRALEAPYTGPYKVLER